MVYYRPFGRIEHNILNSDSGSIRYRWEWGRLVLCDPDLTHPNGRLKHGVTEKLVEKAREHGYKLSASEIRYRVQCAKTYPTEAEIRHVCGEFGNWSDLRAAGFPPVGVVTDEAPYDPRAPRKIREDDAREINRRLAKPGPGGQQPLPGLRIFLPGFTTDTVGRETKFRDAFKIHNHLRGEVTPQIGQAWEQAKRDDRERDDKLNMMFDAVGRNLDATLGDGDDALAAR